MVKPLNLDKKRYQIKNLPISIKDHPRYPYRGFMLDSSRNFITIPKIKELLKAMAAAKFNVFHWHLTDDESFPLELKTFPNISFHGAYSEDKIYSSKSV